MNGLVNREQSKLSNHEQDSNKVKENPTLLTSDGPEKW